MSNYIQPGRLPAWENLSRLASDHPLRLDQLLDDPQRANHMVIEGAGLTLDATRQRVDAKVMKALWQLADQAGVLDRAHQMYQGNLINQTERRSRLGAPHYLHQLPLNWSDFWLSRSMLVMASG